MLTKFHILSMHRNNFFAKSAFNVYDMRLQYASWCCAAFAFLKGTAISFKVNFKVHGFRAV
jgi:hypothetical protein